MTSSPRQKIHLLLLLGLAVHLAACPGGKNDTSDFFDDEPASDEEAPLVSMDAPLSGAEVSGSVSWSATASDDHRVTKISFYAGDSLVQTDTTDPWSGTWDTTELPNGDVEVSVLAEDRAGNSASDVVTVTVANEGGLDPSAIVLSNPTEDAEVCGQVTVETAVSDEVVQVVFSLDDTEMELDTSTPFSWAWDTTASADGPHTITAEASDAAGLSAVDRVEVVVSNGEETCDNPPSILFGEPQEGDVVAGVAEISVTTSDDVGVTGVVFYVDSGLLTSDASVPFGTALSTGDFADGAHTLKAVATDTAGQTDEAEVTFFIDNTAPVVLIDQPDEAELLEGTVTLSATATDNSGLDTVELYLDGTLLGSFTAEPYEVDIDTTLLYYGEHSLMARAVDIAGNEGSDSIEVTVDNPPEVVFTSPTGTTASGEQSVVAEATDDDRVKTITLYQDGAVVDTSTGGSTLSSSIDTCDMTRGDSIELEVIAADTNDNLASETLTLTVDQALQVELDSLAAPLPLSVTLSANVADDQSISNVVFALDGTTVASSTRVSGHSTDCFDCGCGIYEATWNTRDVSAGSHTLTVTATNSAGETATDSATVTAD